MQIEEWVADLNKIPEEHLTPVQKELKKEIKDMSLRDLEPLVQKERTDSFKKMASNEFENWSKLNGHPNIAKLYGAYVDSGLSDGEDLKKVQFLMEYLGDKNSCVTKDPDSSRKMKVCCTNKLPSQSGR